ncbi:MAG: HEAT repeat domain-containing protein [Trueperaceae bacterium]|nr:HEAT repeat domain-containing protein [Trueperaceae bacterium]
MRRAKLIVIFVLILAASTTVAITMGALLLRYGTTGADQSVSWRSLVVAMTGVGAAFGLMTIAHLSLFAARQLGAERTSKRTEAWLRTWSAVAAGGEPPAVAKGELVAASEGASLLMQEIEGREAVRLRAALDSAGVTGNDLRIAAAGGTGSTAGASAALERLAWAAVPAAMPLFRKAATSPEPRVAQAALLGACRVLGAQSVPEPLGRDVVAAIVAHAASAREPYGSRAFLAAAMATTGRHQAWLAATLLGRQAPEAVRAATLDAVGITRTSEAGAVVSQWLGSNRGSRRAVEAEVLSAALKALARLGHLDEAAEEAAVEATRHEHTGVRVQAAHALVGATPERALPALWELLADKAFDVRLAAATALTACGSTGEALLKRCATSHRDPFAMDIASLMRSRRAPAALETSKPAATYASSGD